MHFVTFHKPIISYLNMQNKLYIKIIILLLCSVSFIYSKDEVSVGESNIVIKLSSIDSRELADLQVDSSGMYYAYNFATISDIPFSIDSRINKNNTISKELDYIRFIKFSPSQKNENYTITPIGYFKGIQLYQIRIYPVYKEDNHFKQIEKQSISINFKQAIQLNHNYYDIDIAKFCDEIINPEHLSYLAYIQSLKPIAKQNNEESLRYISPALKDGVDSLFFQPIALAVGENTSGLLQGDTKGKYNPSLSYVEVNTKLDGIAFIPVKEILEKDNNLLVNKDKYKHLHLTKNGIEQAYFIKSPDDFINGNDSIFFVSSRNAGDTTFYDHFNTSAKYYVFYDTSYIAPKFSPQNFTSGNPAIDGVYSVLHFEKDSMYCEGQIGNVDENYHDPKPVNGEGWFDCHFRPNLRPDKERRVDTLLTFNKLFFPADNSKILCNFAFIEFSVNPRNEFNNRIKTQFNNIISYTNDFKYIYDDYKKYNKHYVSADSLLFGYNKLDYLASPLLDSYPESSYYDDAMMGFDYLEISGKFKPIVINDNIAFNTDELSDSRNIGLYPFSSDNVFIFDTLNQVAFNYSSEKGNAIAINSSNILAHTNFYLNNTLTYSSQTIGFHVFYISDNQSVVSESYTEIESFITRINSIKEHTSIAIAVNKQNLSSSDLNLLKSVHVNIDNYQPNLCITAMIDRGLKTSKVNTSNVIAKYLDFIPNEKGAKYKVNITLPAGKKYQINACDYSALNNSILKNTYYSNLRDSIDECNYLVISSRKFKKSAEKYQEYRKQNNPKLIPKLVFVEDIFKEYNFGKKNPSAIKDYIKQVYNNQKKLKLQAILLLGDASNDPRRLTRANIMDDHVPSYGYPMSDNWYVMMEDNENYIPDVLISRIPIQTDEDFENYFGKLITFENSPQAPWKKSVLFMVGGGNPAEHDQFKRYYATPMMNYMKQSNICFDYETVDKSLDSKVSEADGPRIISALNKGKIFTYFVGHGSAEVLDMEGWMPNNLGNYGKTGFFYTSSCFMGAFGVQTSISRIEQLLFVKDRGFIASAANSATDYPAHSGLVAKGMFQSIFDKKYRNYVQAYNYGKAFSLKNYPDASYLPYLRRYVLTGTILGDPLLSLPIDTVAELFLLPDEFTLANKAGSNLINENDEHILLSFTVRNAGVKNFDSVIVRITDKYQNKLDSFRITLRDICPGQTVAAFQIPIKNKLGLHFLTIMVDPDSTLNEYRRDNNSLSRQFEVVKNGILPIDPMPYWNISTNAPHFRFINPIADVDSLKYTIKIYEEGNNDNEIASGNNSNISIKNKVIDWRPQITLKDNTNYCVKSAFWDSASGTAFPIVIPFHTNNNSTNKDIVEHRISKTELKDIQTNNLIYDEDSNNLVPKKDSVKVDFMSIAGSDNLYPYRLYKGIYLSINDKFYISEPLRYGMFIGKFNNDFTKNDIRYYDTWSNVSDDDAHKDDTPIRIVKYLRDSVKAGDNIFIGTSGNPFRIFSLHKKLRTEGSWDTLKTVLNNLGAKEIDIIDTTTINRWENSMPYSYCFFAHIGDGYKIAYDKANVYGDTARIINYLPIMNNNAEISFNINNVDELKSSKLNSIGSINPNKIKHKLFGLNKSTNQFEFIKEYSNSLETVYSDIPQNKYNSYRFDYFYSDENGELRNFSISDLSLKYIPSAEIDVNISKELPKDILRADPDTLHLDIRNLSLRRAVDSLQLKINISDLSANIDEIDTVFYNVPANTNINYQKALQTDNYSDTISISSIVKNVNRNDLYFFNNAIIQKQEFAKDTIKPTIELELDNHIVQTGEYVGRHPVFKIIIRDNSKRAISSDKNIKASINLRYVTPERMKLYEFKSFGKDTNIAAHLIFKPDSLDYDENVIRIIVEDANSNKDTVRYSLYVSRKGELKHISIYPNPVKENSTIYFNYAAPAIDGHAMIEIYDAIGRKVKTQKSLLNIGSNNIPVTLRGDNGEKLSTGLYYYRISILHTEIIVEHKMDKFVIIE